MRFDDRATNRQSQPKTTRLRRVEGVEKLIESRWCQSWSRISHLDENDVTLRFPGADEQLSRALATSVHSFDCIHHQIQHHLLELHPIALQRWCAFLKIHVHRNAVLHCFAASELNDLADCVIDVQELLAR